eukprot:TRINITY_DN26044_c0_g1_i3.p1 TRINITY_DN26044_c0_g1~~TRINITY_DN26044_c0_g1_i3.p1  ORF type:complete len:302 (-),score=51.33 TRINITY_DN26044_c0_g1_i3:234-1139(-)
MCIRDRCYVRAWIALPDLRKLLGLFVFGFSCGIGFWVAASVLPTQVRMVAVALGILFDYGTPWTLLPMMPAIHPMHMPERFACFTLLAFAACLFSLVKNMTQDVDTVRSYSLSHVMVVGVSALLITFPAMILYSHDNGPATVSASTEHWMSSRLKTYSWLYLHLPLTMATMAFGDALAKIGIDTLDFQQGQESEHRWLLCVSVASFFVALGLLHLVSRKMGRARRVLGRRHRCLVRMACGAVVATLGFTDLRARGVMALIVGVGFLQLVLDVMVMRHSDDDNDPELTPKEGNAPGNPPDDC